MWNSGPMLGGATHWPRLNRAGYWQRGEWAPMDGEPAPDETVADPPADDLATDDDEEAS